MAWQERANCIGCDPEAFFSEATTGTPKQVLRVCGACEVQAECLQAGMNEDWGVWGGLSRVQRSRIRKTVKRAS